MFATAAQERSIGQLLSDLGGEISALIRNEIALAQIELKQKAAVAGRNAVYLVIGAVFGFVCLLALVTTVILALAMVMAAWLAALIVTVAIGILAAVLVSKGINAMKQTDLAPRHTVQTLKEDFLWAKQQVQ